MSMNFIYRVFLGCLVSSLLSGCGHTVAASAEQLALSPAYPLEVLVKMAPGAPSTPEDIVALAQKTVGVAGVVVRYGVAMGGAWHQLSLFCSAGERQGLQALENLQRNSINFLVAQRNEAKRHLTPEQLFQ
jgi:hypothetical protein